MYNILMPVLLCMTLQYESFHTVFTACESMGKRLRNCIKGRIPKVDAVRDALARLDPKEIQDINGSVIRKIKRNRILADGTIGQYKVVAIDGVELFSSRKKCCPDCLSRQLKSGETEYFHRSVVCGSVGSDPHIVLGQEMLRPCDGSDKDEGELTGGKRLIRRLKKEFGHFADIIVADALYLNAPFINTVLECDMEAVIRLKDKRRLIFREAEKQFRKNVGQKESFKHKDVTIEVWDLPGLEMKDVKKKIRVLRFQEHRYVRDKDEVREMWLATTKENVSPQILWEIMHKRWDIEENVFHQLKTYYHAKHCYCHAAVEIIFLLIILAFNMRELYLYRRLHSFKTSHITRKSVTRIFCDNLLTENFIPLLYHDSS